MFIEIIFDGIIFNRLQVDLEMTMCSQEETERRKELIETYLAVLKNRYPNASFQLAFESKIHLIETT